MGYPGGGSLSDLIGELRTTASRLIQAIRAFTKVLRDGGERRFGAYERFAGAKYDTPAAGTRLAGEGELPGFQGKPRVTALVVNPYLVHVYWDFDPAALAAAGKAALRFHDVTDAARTQIFDVKVELAARNWYVDLWSPARTYYVELGLAQESGFEPLARSGKVQTPRAWPVAEVAGNVIPAAPGRPAVIPKEMEAPAAGPAAPLPQQPATSASPPVAPGLPPQPERKANEDAHPTPVTALPPPADAAARLQEQLSKLYGLRQWPVSQDPRDAATEELDKSDLAARTEQKFQPGISSGEVGRKTRV